jgi:hypothetical protein
MITCCITCNCTFADKHATIQCARATHCVHATMHCCSDHLSNDFALPKSDRIEKLWLFCPSRRKPAFSLLFKIDFLMFASTRTHQLRSTSTKVLPRPYGLHYCRLYNVIRVARIYVTQSILQQSFVRDLELSTFYKKLSLSLCHMPCQQHVPS